MFKQIFLEISCRSNGYDEVSLEQHMLIKTMMMILRRRRRMVRMKYGRGSRAAHVSRFLPRANISSPATPTLSFRISTFSRQSCVSLFPQEWLCLVHNMTEAGSKWKTAPRPKLTSDNILVRATKHSTIFIILLIILKMTWCI